MVWVCFRQELFLFGDQLILPGNHAVRLLGALASGEWSSAKEFQFIHSPEGRISTRTSHFLPVHRFLITECCQLPDDTLSHSVLGHEGIL